MFFTKAKFYFHLRPQSSAFVPPRPPLLVKGLTRQEIHFERSWHPHELDEIEQTTILLNVLTQWKEYQVSLLPRQGHHENEATDKVKYEICQNQEQFYRDLLLAK